MTTLPSGTVTFLFTDIEGSTKLAQQHPEAMPHLMARHNEILEKSIHAHGGYIFQRAGDSYCAAFHSAVDALHAAFEAQKCLFEQAWTPAPIKVRMGVHTGDAHSGSDGQYTGYTTLALTQRIMSAGHGGQVLLSGAARELARDSLPENAGLVDLGEKRLKDLLRPERLYQLNVPGLPSAFPALKTLDAFPNNLPRQLTTFIGREKEIAEVRRELEEHRLVTLTGSGGTGKTRLCLQVAVEVLEKFDHGVWFVDLAPLADPELIPRALLTAIGIIEQPGKTSLEVVKEFLQDRQTLVLLDNCEHLIDASARVVNALLSEAPRLRILATSREALGVRGELSYPVPSLELPDIRHLPVVEQLSQYEAVRLFLDRASLVAPNFVVDRENAPYIAQICYRLDGIPLAIELAAARVKVLSVEQISARLDDRFRLLTGGARTALPRQQTLRALIDWSYDLLTGSERLLLRRLSVFVGGWTLEAAESICSAQEDGDPLDVLEDLTQLVNKSLVILGENSMSGETRYRMLETIRQYGREKLLESGESGRIRARHLAYFVKLSEKAEHGLYRSGQIFWLNKLDDEFDNIRMALEWSLTTDARSGLQIIYRLRHYTEAHGDFRELGDWLAQFLEAYQQADTLRARCMAVHSFSFFRLGDFSRAIQAAGQSLDLARALEDKSAQAFSLSFLGLFVLTQGNMREGTGILEQSLAIYQELGDSVNQAIVMEWLAVNTSDIERSTAYALESLKIYRELDSLSDVVSILCQLSRITIWRGEFSLPVPWLEEALSLARRLGNRTSQADALSTQGLLAYWQGSYPQACECYGQAIRLGREIGNNFEVLWAQVQLAYAVLRLGEAERARELFAESLRNTRRANMMIAQVYAIEGLASLHASQGRDEHAARLFAWANAVRDRIGDHRPPVERASVEVELAAIRDRLTGPKYDRLAAQGMSMTLEQAVVLALEEPNVYQSN